MANIQHINNTPEDSGLGDNLKLSFDKVNENFTELNDVKIEDAPIDGTEYVRKDGDWVQGGSSIYDGNSPSTRSIENLPSGTDLTNLTLTDLLENIYAPFIMPTFTSFSISSQATIIEIGSVFSGNKTFLWSTSTSGNVKPNSISIHNISASTILADQLENDGVQILNIGTNSTTTPRTIEFRIYGEATNDNLFQRNYSVSTLYPYFFGKSLTQPIINQSLINGGTKVVADSTGTITVNFNASGEFLWFAIPNTSTSKTKWFVDALNNGNIGGISNLFGDLELVEIDSPTSLWSDVNYKIYISNYATTAGNMQLRNS